MLSRGRVVRRRLRAFAAREADLAVRTFRPAGDVARTCPICGHAHGEARCSRFATALLTKLHHIGDLPMNFEIEPVYVHTRVTAAMARLEALQERRDALETELKKPVCTIVDQMVSTLLNDPSATFAAPDVTPQQQAELRALTIAVTRAEEDLKAAREEASRDAWQSVAPTRRKHTDAIADALERALAAARADMDLCAELAGAGHDFSPPAMFPDEVDALQRIIERARVAHRG